MEKYFKIEVRIGHGLRELKTGYQLIGCFYYGDGYIKINDDKISGVIAFDYIEGKIDDETVVMHLHTEEAIFDMDIATEEFDLPGVFLMVYTSVTLELCVEEVIRDPQKQRSIQKSIAYAKDYVGL